jgi:hypothetical protein
VRKTQCHPRAADTEPSTPAAAFSSGPYQRVASFPNLWTHNQLQAVVPMPPSGLTQTRFVFSSQAKEAFRKLFRLNPAGTALPSAKHSRRACWRRSVIWLHSAVSPLSGTNRHSMIAMHWVQRCVDGYSISQSDATLHRKATVKCRWLPARWFETCAWVATADSATHRSRYSALTPGLSFLAAGGGGDVRASFPGDRLRLGG